MNVLLTDVKAPAAPTLAPMVDASSDTGKKNFGSLMQESLQSESKNKLQVVENNESNKVLGDSIIGTEPLLEAGLVPGFWQEHLDTSDIEVITETSPMIQSGDKVTSSELLSNVVIPISSDANSKTMSTALPVVGENLPVNGNSLPLSADQIRSVGLMSNIRGKPLLQAQQSGAPGQNLTEAPNSKGAASDSAIFDSNSKSVNPDLLDSLTSKTFELNTLQQTASESSNARLQAAMAAINGLQNPSANPGAYSPNTANPVASTSVLSDSLERMVMTNPSSSAEWGSGLGERVSLMLNQKHHMATIRLDPPMLGKMDIQIQVKDDVTNVTINTQHAQTRDMVDSASHRLREFLQDAGYPNVNVDVSHQSDQQKNEAQFMADSDSVNGSESGATSSSDELQMTAQVTLSDSLIDYFA
jgi:flagellar hook-length control protein FliK